MAVAAGESFGVSADWTAAVEGAVRSEFVRRRSWLRVYLGVLLLLMIATLVLLALGVMDVTELRRGVQPALAASQRLETTQTALVQGQANLDARLRDAETSLAALTKELAQRPQATPAAAPAPTPPKRRPSGPSRVERQVAAIDQRLQRVESAASAAEAHRARIDGRLQRLDDTVTRLGAAIGPQSAP